MSAQLPSTDTLDHNGLAEYYAEQDSLLEVYGGEVFEPYLWVRADQKMAGDEARYERSCGAWCEGCPVCEESLGQKGDI